jgi:hypothetical protein
MLRVTGVDPRLTGTAFGWTGSHFCAEPKQSGNCSHREPKISIGIGRELKPFGGNGGSGVMDMRGKLSNWWDEYDPSVFICRG